MCHYASARDLTLSRGDIRILGLPWLRWGWLEDSFPTAMPWTVGILGYSLCSVQFLCSVILSLSSLVNSLFLPIGASQVEASGATCLSSVKAMRRLGNCPSVCAESSEALLAFPPFHSPVLCTMLVLSYVQGGGPGLAMELLLPWGYRTVALA